MQDVVVDPESRRVWRGDVEIRLSRKEFDLLYALISRAGQIVSRDVLMQEVWQTTFWTSVKTIDVHLGWLRRPRKQDWAIADAMLEQLGLADLAERQIGQLSGGQQQRALLARALAQQADLLLLDEPLNAVDAETREVVARVLDSLRCQGKTFVVATHDLGRLEADFDQALYLSGGREVPAPPGALAIRALGQEAVWSGS